MPAVGAGAAGAAEAASAAIPGGSGAGAADTDAQNLGIELAEDDAPIVMELDDAPAEEAEGAEAAGEDGEAAEGAEAGAAAPGTEAEPGIIPPELKGLMSDPKVAPHIQRLVDQNQAYRAFGTVRDARTFSENFPGGVREALEYREKGLALDDADERFESGDPGAQSELAAEWMQRAPEATVGMIGTTLGVLRESNPQLYQQAIGNVVRQFATDAKWDLQLSSIGHLLSQVDEKYLGDPVMRNILGQVQWLVEQAEKSGIRYEERGRVSPDRDAIDKQREKLNTDRQGIEEERFNFAVTRTNTTAKVAFRQAATASISKALETSAFPDKGKTAITQEIINTVDRTLRADQNLQRQASQIIRRGGYTDAAIQQAARLIANRGKALLAPTAKKVIAQRTEEFIATNSKAASRRTGAARVDVSSGQAVTARPRRFTQEQLQGMTDAEKDNLYKAHTGL